MLVSLITRLIHNAPGPEHDHLFTPYAPNGAPAQLLARLYRQYADAFADEPAPPQHRVFRALVDKIVPTPIPLDQLHGLELRQVSSAYIACFERNESFQFQLSLWRGDQDFRRALIDAREQVIAELEANAEADAARRAYYSRWNECRAAPIDIRGESTLDLIRKMRPDDWHEIVLHWDWDHGVAELNWITSQRDCDRATAVYVLCLGAPGDVATYASTYCAGFVRTVAARLENGFYPNAELDLALSQRQRLAFVRQLDLARATGVSPWQLPEGLLDHPGREHQPKYAISDGLVRYHYDYWRAHVADR